MKYTNQKVKCLKVWAPQVQYKVTVGKIYDFPLITFDDGEQLELNRYKSVWKGIFNFEPFKEVLYEIY